MRLHTEWKILGHPIILLLEIKVYLTVGSFPFVFIGHLASFPYSIVSNSRKRNMKAKFALFTPFKNLGKVHGRNTQMWSHSLCTVFQKVYFASWYVMTQLSACVQPTMGIAALMPAALTTWTASRVPAYLDTPVMDLPVQVSHFALTFTHVNYNVINTNVTDSLCVTATLADVDHILTAHVCKRTPFYLPVLFKTFFRLTGKFSVRQIPSAILCLISVRMRKLWEWLCFQVYSAIR